jgi:hypothetical protein
MTKFRPPTPHTPPPTSKRGDSLRVPRNGLPWALRDARGVVHSPRGHSPACRHIYDDTDRYDVFEDTLAAVSCLWCIAGVQR